MPYELFLVVDGQNNQFCQGDDITLSFIIIPNQTINFTLQYGNQTEFLENINSGNQYTFPAGSGFLDITLLNPQNQIGDAPQNAIEDYMTQVFVASPIILPMGLIAPQNKCNEGNGEAAFNLDSLGLEIITNTDITDDPFSEVRWFTDTTDVSTQIVNPASYSTTTTSVFAQLQESGNSCPSYFLEVLLDVKLNPEPDIMGDLTICSENTTQLFLENPYISINWDVSNNGSDTIIQQEAIIVDANFAGPIRVIVEDEFGCIGEDVDQLQVSYLIESFCTLNTLVSEPGAEDGAINVNISSGGIPDFTVILNGPPEYDENNIPFPILDSGNFPVLGLPVGQYNVSILDAFGCEAACQFEMELCSLEANLSPNSKTELDCFGDSNGTLIIDISGNQGDYTVNWNQDGLVGEVISDLPSGMYSAEVTDDLNCVTQLSVQITEPSLLFIDSCSGTSPTNEFLSDGQIFTSWSGGNAPYQVILSGDNAINDTILISTNTWTFSVLPNGNYEVIVLDARGCTTSCTLVLEGPPCDLSLESSIDPISCASSNDGSITIDAESSFPPFQFLWDLNANNTSTQENLAPGAYQVTVIDHIQCVDSLMITLTEPDSLTLICNTPIAPSIIGGNDGSFEVNIAGGTAPYQIIIQNDTTSFANSGTFEIDGLSSGNYSIIILDDNSCYNSCEITIPIPNCDLMLDIITEMVNCFGESQGSIQLTIFNGNAPFDIQVEPMVDEIIELSSNSFAVENLLAGNYEITVTDSVGCQITSEVTITQPQPLDTLNLSIQLPQQLGGSTGSIQFEVEGGTPPYSIFSNNELIVQQSNPLIFLSNLPAGEYEILIQDSNNCDFLFEVVIPEVDCSFDYSFSIDSVFCAGVNQAGIGIHFQTNAFPITVESQPTVSINLISVDSIYIPNLESGDYNLIFTNGLGCPQMLNFQITSPDSLFLNCTNPISPSEIDLEDGQITLGISGGTAPYSLTIQGTDNAFSYLQVINSATIASISILPVGSFTATITDANMCTATCSFIIPNVNTLPCDIELMAQVNNINCQGDSTGSILVTVQGGTPPFDLEVVPNFAFQLIDVDTFLISAVPADTFSLIINDIDNCTDTLSVEVFEPPTITINCSDVSPASSSTSFDGNVNVTLSGGTPPYQVEVSDIGSLGEFVGSFSISDLGVGTYTITVVDQNMCESTCNFTILSEMTENPPSNDTCEDAFSFEPILFFNDCPIDTILIDTFFGNSTQATFSNTTLSVQCNTSGQFSELSWDVWFELVILEEDVSNIELKLHTQFDAPHIVLFRSDCEENTLIEELNCFYDEDEDGIISISLTDIELGNCYKWLLGSPEQQGEYQLITKVRYQKTLESLGLEAADAGEDIFTDQNSISLQAVPPTNPIIIGTWSTSESVIINDPNDPSTLVSGFSTCQNTFLWELSTEGCPSYDSDEMMVFQQSDFLLNAMNDSFTIPFDQISFQMNVLMNDSYRGPKDSLTIDVLDNSQATNLTLGLSNNLNGFLPIDIFRDTFYYTITNDLLCEGATDTARVIIRRITPRTNAFSPNGDGINDFFEFPEIDGRLNIELRVFNRWHHLVYFSSSYQNDWDGTQMDTGKPLPDGTYAYTLSGEGILRTGLITIVRNIE